MWNKPPQVTMQPKATCTRLAVAPWIHYDQSTKQLYLDLLKVCALRRPSHLSNFVEVNIGICKPLSSPHQLPRFSSCDAKCSFYGSLSRMSSSPNALILKSFYAYLDINYWYKACKLRFLEHQQVCNLIVLSVFNSSITSNEVAMHVHRSLPI